MSALPSALPEAVEPPVRGEGLLRRLEVPFLKLERALPAALVETGALANVSLATAIGSGIVLLLWYSPSVHDAHASVRAMEAAPLTAGLVRSLHRYSSDATVLFAALHALRLFLARRFVGARWLAWVTGIALVGLLWFVGWLGYWLVWDEPARQIAVGSARLVDGLPIFADPLSRSFLADVTLNSLIFFVVFFVHMLLPLAMGVFLWLHIARVSRSRFFPNAKVSAAAVGVMVALSLGLPAAAGAPAKMAVLPRAFEIDAWFLFPLALTDRLGAGALWAVGLVGGALVFAAPWLLGRGRARVALVDGGRCNACTLCFRDCPYDAIRLVPREGGPVLAQVDASKCVGCGICAGACDAAAIALPWRPVLAARKRVDAWLERERRWVAYVCAESAGGRLAHPITGDSPRLPGWNVVTVPCSGWLHPLTVERALRHGAPGVLVATCAGCRFREGHTWTAQRVAQAREPILRSGGDRVRVVALDRDQPDALVRAAEDFVAGRPSPAPSRRVLAAGIAGVALTGAAWAGSHVPYVAPEAVPELVVSFKHPGQVSEDCRTLSQEEKLALPPHMRRDRVCDRARASVRLRVRVDGREAVARSYAPRGLWGDGNSVGVEHLALAPGVHAVEVALGDAHDPAAWAFVDARDVEIVPGERRVVTFDRVRGFEWN
ncbi:MAG: hydrogenase iron-sulfur subunit [Myxococcota bacterium]